TTSTRRGTARRSASCSQTPTRTPSRPRPRTCSRRTGRSSTAWSARPAARQTRGLAWAGPRCAGGRHRSPVPSMLAGDPDPTTFDELPHGGATASQVRPTRYVDRTMIFRALVAVFAAFAVLVPSAYAQDVQPLSGHG